MNKGFTLIELLAVIFLLATLALIAAISVFGILSDSRESLYEEQVNTIEEAAKNYQLVTPGLDNTTISLETLSEEGYLDSDDLVDPRDKSQLCGGVNVTYNEGSSQYYFEFVREEC